MATSSEYRSFLQSFVQGSVFAASDEETQQKMLARVRDEFKQIEGTVPSEIDFITQEVNKEYRRANNMGRHIPSGITITGPWDEPEFESLSEEEKVAKIEDYRTRIPEIASQDTLNYDDTKYYLNRVFDEQKRIAQGENTGWVEDKAWRLFDGLAAGIASKLGDQGAADSIRSWSETNPKYDEDFTAQLAQGVGDIGASTAIFLGATALSGGNATVGGAALLGSGGVERYTTTYKQAIEQGLNQEDANAAGIGALPAAAVDFLGDRLLAGKFLPKNYDYLLKTGSLEAKKAAISEIFANGQLRASALKVARDGMAQGLSEAGGDFTAGYGAYLTTGDEEFKASVSDLRDSFLVGSVIGAGMSGIETTRDRITQRQIGEKLKEEVQQEEAPTEDSAAQGVSESIRQGQFQDAEAKTLSSGRFWNEQPQPFGPALNWERAAKSFISGRNFNRDARPFLPEIASEEMLPAFGATEDEIAAYEALSSPGRSYALEVAAFEELTAFGRPEGAINNYGEKIRTDFLAKPEPIEQEQNTELREESIPVSELPENTVQINESGDPVIENQDAIDSLESELNNRFGEGQWRIRLNDTLEGAITAQNFRQEAENALSQEGGTLNLKGFQVEPFNPNTEGQPTFQVHVIRKNGQLQVVPYATINKNLETPFVFENESKSTLEQTALQAAEASTQPLDENQVLSIEVTLGKDRNFIASEPNAESFAIGSQAPTRNPYVNAAIYSAIQGRTPAFAIHARQAIRDQSLANRWIDDVTYDIAKNLPQLAENQQDFANQVEGFYGQDFAPVAGSLWQAARDNNMDAVRSIIAEVELKRRQKETPQVLSVNDEALNIADAQLSDAAKAASDATKARKRSTQQPAEELNEVFSIPQGEGEMTVDAVQAIVDDLTGGSENVRVINDPSAPFAGRILNRRDIQLNAARIQSVEHAREVLLEEAIHAVWNDAGIQDAWAGIKALATRDEVEAIKTHYENHGVNITYSTALEEWANREVRRKYLQEEGPVKSFIDRVWQKLKEIFGIAAPENASDAARIMHRALEYLSEESIKGSRSKPAAPVNAYMFSNGQIAGPGNFYILGTHSNRGLFTPTDRNPLGEINHSFMSSGEGQQTYGWGTYMGSSWETTNFYMNYFSIETAGVDPKFDDYVNQVINIGLENDLRSLWLNYSNEDFIAGMILAKRKQLGNTSNQPASATETDFILQEIENQNRYLAPEDQMRIIINYDELEKINKSIHKFSQGTASTLQVRFNATPENLLDWDLSFQEQSNKVKATLEREFPSFFSNPLYTPDSPQFGRMMYDFLERKFGSPKNASSALYRTGIKGIQYFDGGSRAGQSGTRNYVAFNEADMEVMSDEISGKSFSLDSPGNLLKADQELYSIPQDQKKEQKRQQQRERLSRLKRLKIEDRYDTHTKTISNLLRKIKPKEVEQLSENHVDDFYDLVDHLYQARTHRIANPDIREDSNLLIDELRQYRRLLDAAFIQRRIAEMGDVMDYSAAPLDDREAFESFENQLAKNNKIDLSKQTSKNREAWERKQQAWRAKFEEARSEFLTIHPTSEAWINDIEELNGKKFKSARMREMMAFHYEYMMQIASPSDLEGTALYNHFHELNNMLDGQSVYMPETSIKWVGDQRDAGINIYDLKGKFRDPVIMRNEFLKGIDLAQRVTELKQTQLARFSAFQEGKDFLQNDLMGPLLDSILRESANNQADSQRRYLQAKKTFEKNVGRKLNNEDTIIMSLVSRLIQFPIGQDPNVAFRENYTNELKAIENITGNAEREGRGSKAMQDQMRDVIRPIFDRLTNGLNQSAIPMEDFIATIEDRMGLGQSAIGKQRSLLLSQAQELMDEYSLDAQFVSESFYKKPFKAYANYMPRRAIPINPEKLNARNHDITQEIGEFDDQWYQSNSITAETESLKSRSKIGDNAYYSNNFEYLFDRGIRINSLTGSTTAERFILKHRLRKDSEINNLIKGSNSTYRVDQLREWASSLFLNAMHSGSPLGTLGVWMKRLNEMYARVALSGLHQGVTQSASGFADYHIRTGNIGGAMQAAHYMVTHREFVDQWFEKNASRISNRSLLGEQELDRRRSPSFSESEIRNHPMVKRLEDYYEGATKIITFSLRQGDDFVAKSLVLAEYARLMKDRGHKFQNISDMDWNVVDGQILTTAMLNVEQNINSSDKITRGELFTDRTWGLSMIRNLSLAFASHTMVLSAQFNQSIRDLIDLKAQGASKDKMANQIRTIGAILGQTFVFSSSRFAINATMATIMLGLLRDLFDDEEGKLTELQQRLDHARETGDDVRVQAAQAELAAAKAIRDTLLNFENRNTSFTSYFQGVLKEELGAIHFAFQGPGLPQKFIFPIADNFGEKMYKESVKAESEKMKQKIAKAKANKQFGKAARLTEDLHTLESVEYLPLNIEQFGNIGLGGITGTALSATYASWKEANNAFAGLTEYNWNDVVLAAQSAGLGQADVNRFLKTVDMVEDDLYKRGVKSQEQADKARARQQAQDERAAERQLRALLNQIE